MTRQEQKAISEVGCKRENPQCLNCYDFDCKRGLEGFKKGYNEALRWRVIERDKDGFAKEECLDEIFSHNQVLLLLEDNSVDVIAQDHDKVEWLGDIERKPRYAKWRPIETI